MIFRRGLFVVLFVACGLLLVGLFAARISKPHRG